MAHITGSIDNVSVREVGQDWTLGTGWSIGEDKAISDGSGSIPNTDLVQSNVFTTGKSYKVTLEIKDYVSGNLQLQNNTTNFPQSNGIHTIYSSTGSTSLILRSLSFIGSVTNISVKEVGQNWDLGDGWSISDGKAVAVSGVSSKLTQSISGLSGKKCSVTFTLSNYGGSGNIKLDFGSVVGQNRNANGTYTEVGTYDIDRFEFFKNAGFEGSITNISVIEITDDTNLPRINYEGFSYQDALGSEEVVNGDYEQSGIGNALSQSGGILVNENNQLKITSNGSSGFSRAVWNTNGLEGEQFLIKADIISVSGNTRFIDISNNQGQSLTQGTTFSTIITLGSAIKQVGFGGLSDTSFELVIDNVSVKEYLGQEVVPDSGCGSWLWEPQSTNLITQSELFSDATWTKVGGGAADDTIITSNYATSPDGTNNASRAQFNAVGTANGDRANLYANINVTSGQTFTMSFYGKSATATNEEVVLRMGSVQQVSVTLTQEYQRFSHTYTVTSSGAKNFGIQIRGNSAVTSADIIIWGFQVEQQSYATSYIPTSGSTVTRNQDLCTNGGSLASINSTEGVLYAEIAALADGGTFRGISLNDGTTNNNNVIRIYCASADNRITIIIRANGSLIFNYSHTLTSITDFNKIAIKYKQNDFSLWVNGINIHNQTTGNTPIGLNELLFNNGLGTEIFFGKTKALAVWKEALSDAELTELTTI